MTAEVETGAEALLVEIGGRLAVLCAAAAIDAGLRVVLVPGVREAVHRIRRKRPRVVIVPGTFDAASRAEVAAATRIGGGELVELPAHGQLDEAAIDDAVARAVRATSHEDVPPTQRSSELSSPAAR